MGRLIRVMIYLIILGFIGLTGYAYVGPLFDVDFAPEQQEMRVPVTLEAN